MDIQFTKPSASSDGGGEIVVPCLENGDAGGSAADKLLVSDGQSELITCTSCSVCVHKRCYGVEENPPSPSKTKDPWLCTKCAAKAQSQRCCLCTLRGGAFKQTTDSHWAHIVCALVIPEVIFVNQLLREPLDISLISNYRYDLKCVYCYTPLSEHPDMATQSHGASVQCSVGRCLESFHVTCAHAANLLVQICDWPKPIYIACRKHCSRLSLSGERKVNNKLPRSKFGIGGKILARYRNGKYYEGVVRHVDEKTYYELEFELDGSITENTEPKYIKSHDCLAHGPPPIGTHVDVLWTDDKLWGAVFKGVNEQDIYHVEFEDKNVLLLKRDLIHSLTEQLPKKVQARLAKTSILEEFPGVPDLASRSDDSKRRVKINSKYVGRQFTT